MKEPDFIDAIQLAARLAVDNMVESDRKNPRTSVREERQRANRRYSEKQKRRKRLALVG